MKRALLIIVVFLLVTSGLAMLLQGFSRLYLAEPILRILLLVRVLIAAIPQPILWGVFLLIAVFSALRVLFSGFGPSAHENEPGKPHRGRVSQLAYWIRQSEQGHFFRWQIAQHLSALALEALAYRYRTSEENVKRQLRAGEIAAPESTRAYFRAGLSRVYSDPRGSVSRILTTRGPQTSNSALDLDPMKALEYIEQQLETTHDDEAF